MKRYFFIFIFIILFVVQYTTSASMPKYVPEAYWGYVFIDGRPAPNGTVITVEGLNSKRIGGKSEVVGNKGLYSLDILIYDPDFSKLEGLDNHESVIWKVNGITASVPSPGNDTAESGEVNYLNISASNLSSVSTEDDYLYSIFIILIVVIAPIVFYKIKK